MTQGVDQRVRDYIDAIDPAHRPLFDRLDGLIRRACPEVETSFSYQMPAYRHGKRRLYLGVWKHGVSIYGMIDGHDAGFTERHPDLRTGKGTIRLGLDDAAAIGDAEFLGLFGDALTILEG